MGTYTATLAVTDDAGASASDSATVTVSDVLTANANGPYTGTAGSAISFSGSASGGSGTGYTYSWDFGDGTPLSTEQNPSHTYTTVGTYTATLTVTDDAGATDSDTAEVTIETQALINKDFRYTNVDFDAPIAELGDLLPDADGNGKFDVKYVTKKDGTVSSTNPGQLYSVISIAEAAGVTCVSIDDTFGTQFDVNPGHVGGGIEIIRINSAGSTEVLTYTSQVTGNVDNDIGKVTVNIELDTPLENDEKLMIYVKFKTALRHDLPEMWDFVNQAEVIIDEGASIVTEATIEFV